MAESADNAIMLPQYCFPGSGRKTCLVVVDELKRSPLVSEVLLWNNDSESNLELPGVKVINSPRNYHCLARYCMVPLAENNEIWFQDDDLVVRPSNLKQSTRLTHGILRGSTEWREEILSMCLLFGRCSPRRMRHRSRTSNAFSPQPASFCLQASWMHPG